MTDTINGAVVRLLKTLPDAIKEKAYTSILNAEDMRWDSGDLSIDIIDEHPIDPYKNKPYSKTAIRMTVATLYHTVESTIRSREYVCRNITPDIRASKPGMTYEYWRACCGAKPVDGQKKRRAILDVADQIDEYTEAYGCMPSVSAVRSWTSEDELALVYIARTESIISHCEKIIEDERTPPRLARFLDRVKGWLASYLGS